MKIRAIRLRNIKNIGDTGLIIENITDGLNVLSEENEFGKSTIFEGLRHGILSKHSSKTTEIKALQPYVSSEGPEVEIDIEWSGGFHRIKKQFLAKSMTSIVDLENNQIIESADDAQQWIKDLIGVGDKHSGPTGLLWVTQGKSMHSHEMDDEDKSIFSSVLDNEVSTLVSGERGRAAFKKTIDSISNYLTKKERPTGIYKDVSNSLENLDEEINEAKSKLSRTENSIIRLEAIERRLKSLESDKQDNTHKAELENYEKLRVDAIKAQAEEETLKIKLDQASKNYDSQLRSLTNLEEQTNKFQEHKSFAGALSEKINSNKHNLGKLDDIKKEQKSKLDEMDAQIKEAREQFRKAAEAQNAEEKQLKLKELQNNFGNAKKLTQDLKKASNKIEKIKVSAENISALELLQGQLASLKEKIATSRISAKVFYQNNDTRKIWLESEQITEGQTFSLEGITDIKIDGVGTIQITNPIKPVGDLEAELIKLNRSSEKLLAELGITSVPEGKKLIISKKALEGQRDNIERDIIRFAPHGINALDLQIDKIKAELGSTHIIKISFKDAEEEVVRLEKEESRVEDLFRQTQEEINDHSQKFSSNTARLESHEESIKELEKTIGIEEKHADNLTLARKILGDFDQIKHKAELDLTNFSLSMPDIESIEAAIDRIEVADQNRTNEKNNLEVEKATHSNTLMLMSAEGVAEELDDLRGRYEKAKRQKQSIEHEIRSLQLLRDTLSKTQEQEKEKLFEPVIKEIGPLARHVIPGINFKFGDDFAASEIIRNGTKETVNSLSGGTQEQIAILTRLVFARLKAKQGHPTPVILDDALVFSDDNRISSMFNALNVVAKDVQVIVLTCRQKSFEGLGGNLLKPTAWK